MTDSDKLYLICITYVRHAKWFRKHLSNMIKEDFSLLNQAMIEEFESHLIYCATHIDVAASQKLCHFFQSSFDCSYVTQNPGPTFAYGSSGGHS